MGNFYPSNGIVVEYDLNSVNHEKPDRLDLQNVGWWMGITSYVACTASKIYQAQYEKYF